MYLKHILKKLIKLSVFMYVHTLMSITAILGFSEAAGIKPNIHQQSN